MKKILIYTIGISIILLALSQVGMAGEKYESYQLEVKLLPNKHLLEGSQKLTYINSLTHPLKSIFFLLIPNYGKEKNPYLDDNLIDENYWNGFDPSWLTIKSVSSGEKLLDYKLREVPPTLQTYSLKDTLLEVDLPNELGPGEQVTLDIEFATKFPHMTTGDQSYHRGIYTWRFGWHPMAVSGKNLIEGRYISEKKSYYKFEIPASFYKAKVTVPANFMLVSGADKQKIITENDNWKTYQLTSENPIRQVALHIGKSLNKYSLDGPVPIDVYYRSGHDEEARLFATYAQDILDYYQARFGDYNHRKLVIAEANGDGLFGLASDGMIILGSSFFSEKDLTVPAIMNRFTDYVIAHELAHQWWGMGVGTDFNAENYISEAFAQYLSITYFEQKYGEFEPNLFQLKRKGLFEKLVENQLGFYNLREHMVEFPYLQVYKDDFDEAIIKPTEEVKYGNYTYTRIYNKGYLVLRSLEGTLGKDTMNEILKKAYKKYNYKIITTEDFKKLAEEISEKDLDDFFNQTLRSDHFADYGVKKVEVEESENGYVNKIHLIHKGQINQPVKVVAITEDDQRKENIWRGENGEGIMTIETQKPVKKVQIDPGELFLDVNRLNNYYPRKLKVITTGKNALPLDAYVIRFDPFTQTLQGGYLWHRWLIGNEVFAFTRYLGRGSSITGIVGTTGENLVGEIALDTTVFSYPETGSPAEFVEPSAKYHLSFRRDLSLDKGILNYLSLGYERRESVTDLKLTDIRLYLDPFNFSRVTLRGQDRTRIWPNIYLDSEIIMGISSGYLPAKLKFKLNEFKSFGKWVDTGIWESKLFPGNIKLFGSLSLNFPLQREMGYYVANLAKIDNTTETFFIKVGDTWDSWEDIGLDDLKAEVGTEIALSGTMFGGLFPVNFRIGYARPLWARNEETAGHLYINLQLPFL